MKFLNLAVLISGHGRTLENFLDLSEKDLFAGNISLVVSSSVDKPNIALRERLNKLDITIVHVTLEGSAKSSFVQSNRVFDLCEAYKIDLVCMAGWVNYLPIPNKFKNKVINVHPSLLPAFGGQGMYGMKVHEAVLERGCKFTGVTVHFADDSYDGGPIIAQTTVRVENFDTPQSLAQRVFQDELLLYPDVIKAYADGRIRVDGNKVTVA